MLLCEIPCLLSLVFAKCTCSDSSDRSDVFCWVSARGAQWVAASRSTGIVNTTDRSFDDARLKNSALADGQEPLIWAWIRRLCGCLPSKISELG